MRFVRRLLLAALFVGVLVLGWRFAADHSELVVIKIPAIEGVEVPLWTTLLVSFAAGAAVTGVFATMQLARQGLLSRRYRKIIRDLEAEVHQLRNLPLSEEEATLEARNSGGVDPDPGRALGRGA